MKKLILMSFMFLTVFSTFQMYYFNNFVNAEQVTSSSIEKLVSDTDMSTTEIQEQIEIGNIVSEGITINSNGNIEVDENFLMNMGIEKEQINLLNSIDTTITAEEYESIETSTLIDEMNFEAMSVTKKGNTIYLKLTPKDVKIMITGGYAIATIVGILGTIQSLGTSWIIAGVIIGAISSIASTWIPTKNVLIKIPSPSVSRTLTITSGGKKWIRKY